MRPDPFSEGWIRAISPKSVMPQAENEFDAARTEALPPVAERHRRRASGVILRQLEPCLRRPVDNEPLTDKV